MKRYRHILLLALSLVLLLGILSGCGKKAPAETADDTAATDGNTTNQQATRTLSYSNGSATLYFICDETETWHWRDDPSFPLQTNYILDILSTVDTMAAAQPIQDAKAPAEYGLDSHDKYLTTTGEDGQSLTFYFGSTAESGAYYMMRSDVPNQIYEAPVVLTAQLNRGIFDMMTLPQIPPLNTENTSSITVQGPNEVSFTLTKQADGTWLNGTAATDDQANLLLTELAAMTVQSAIDYRPSAGVTGLCGLDTPAAVLSVSYVNTVNVENTLTLQIGGVRGEGRYALFNDDTTIYLIPSAQLTQLLALAEKGI